MKEAEMKEELTCGIERLIESLRITTYAKDFKPYQVTVGCDGYFIGPSFSTAVGAAGFLSRMEEILQKAKEGVK